MGLDTMLVTLTLSLYVILIRQFYCIRKTEVSCSSHCSSDSKYVIDSQQKLYLQILGKKLSGILKLFL